MVFRLKMRWVCWPYFCLGLSKALLADLAEHPTIERPTVILGQGEQRAIRTPGILKYSLGSPIVRILQFPKHPFGAPSWTSESLLIKGVLPGSTSLWVWKKDGSVEIRTIRVEKQARSEVSPQFAVLEKALSHLTEAEVIFTGHGIVLRGEIHSLAEAARIYDLTRNFPKVLPKDSQPIDETQLSEELLNLGFDKLDPWIRRCMLPTDQAQSKQLRFLRIERVGNQLWLRGQVIRASEVETLSRQAHAIFAPIHVELEAPPDQSPTIHFRVFLLELKKNQFSTLGLSWPATVPGAFQVTSGSIHDLTKIDLTIQALEGNGNIRILSNPELVVRAPGEAELFAGGELPVETHSRYYSNVAWKKYGLTLRLNVTHCTGDRVRLEIFTEVSHLDSTLTTDKIPGIQANRMKTQVDARFGNPLFLSGLLQKGIRENAKGLPFFRNIPILGSLFGSEDYLNEQSELVAILYPHASPPSAPAENSMHLVPRGLLPVPRNWIDPREQRALRNSQDYPWNALQ